MMCCSAFEVANTLTGTTLARCRVINGCVDGFVSRLRIKLATDLTQSPTKSQRQNPKRKSATGPGDDPAPKSAKKNRGASAEGMELSEVSPNPAGAASAQTGGEELEEKEESVSEKGAGTGGAAAGAAAGKESVSEKGAGTGAAAADAAAGGATDDEEGEYPRLGAEEGEEEEGEDQRAEDEEASADEKPPKKKKADGAG
jgi:hypothetical protein